MHSTHSPHIHTFATPQVRWEDAVLIFDEAHNVEGVCSDASSFDITAKNLADAMQEARRFVWDKRCGGRKAIVHTLSATTLPCCSCQHRPYLSCPSSKALT